MVEPGPKPHHSIAKLKLPPICESDQKAPIFDITVKGPKVGELRNVGVVILGHPRFDESFPLGIMWVKGGQLKVLD